MRVVHYVPVWLPQTEVWLYDQLTQLPEWVENHVVCEATANLGQFAVRNLHCLTDASALRWYWDKGLRKLRIRNDLGYLTTQAQRINPQIVHSHFGNVGWANYKAVKRIGARHIVTFYGLDVSLLPKLHPHWRARYRELFLIVNRVLCEGPHMARCIIELGCPQEKVGVHHLGVRVDEIPYRPRSWQPGTPLRVLIAATFREKKGIPYALAALGAIRREVPVQLTVIGDATAELRSQDEKARILAALEEYGLKPQTRLLGFCAYEKFLKEAYDHHVFLSPSVTATDGDTEGGAPVGIIQMAASGMPIVSTRHCDIPNALPTSAELAEERDGPGLVHRLRWLVENAGNWEPELAEARRHVELKFDAHIQGQRLAEIYAEVAGVPARRVNDSTAMPVLY
jgi:colanic acid/amylovoran biosynthesis glycosyltransferase